MHIQYVEYLIALNVTHIILFSCTLHIIHLVTKQCINAIYPIPPGRAASRDNDEGSEESWEAGDLLGKVLSPQATAFLEECCGFEGIKYLNLIQWVCTHWGSMYSLTERVLALWKVHQLQYYHDD